MYVTLIPNNMRVDKVVEEDGLLYMAFQFPFLDCLVPAPEHWHDSGRLLKMSSLPKLLLTRVYCFLQ